MLKKKWIWSLVILAVIAAGGGGTYYYKTKTAVPDMAATQSAAMQTATAKSGDIVVMATGSGKVVVASQIDMGFSEPGTLSELNVKVGDVVKAGDVLARLATENTEEEIAAEIADAELSVIQAQRSLDDLYANADTLRATAMNDIATYAQAVRDAQYTLENYSMPTFLQGLGAVEAVDQTKAALDEALAAFEPYKYLPASNDIRYARLVDLNLAQSNYDAAIKRLNYEYTLEVAEANLEKARDEYAKYENGPAADDLTEAQAILDNSKARLELARKTQHVVDLTAPFDGMITTVDAVIGETLSSGAIITLADTNNLRIEVYLDESDMDMAKAGNEAEVSFEAVPDQVFKGEVISVSPGLETVDNVQAVKVIVKLDEGTTPTDLLIGLTASVDVIAGRAYDAVLVPVEALRQLDPNEYALFVIENGQPVLRVVQVGLQDVTSAEILSGVEAGETVTTGIIQTQ